MKKIFSLSIFALLNVCVCFSQPAAFIIDESLRTPITDPTPQEFMDTCQNIDAYNGKTISLAIETALAHSAGWYDEVETRPFLYSFHVLKFIFIYPPLEYVDGKAKERETVYMYLPDRNGAFSGIANSFRYYYVDPSNRQLAKKAEKIFDADPAIQAPTSDQSKWAWGKMSLKCKVNVTTDRQGHKHVTFSGPIPKDAKIAWDFMMRKEE